MCVCVSLSHVCTEREREYVYVCLSLCAQMCRGGQKYMRERERERESVSVCAHMCVCEGSF